MCLNQFIICHLYVVSDSISPPTQPVLWFTEFNSPAVHTPKLTFNKHAVMTNSKLDFHNLFHHAIIAICYPT